MKNKIPYILILALVSLSSCRETMLLEEQPDPDIIGEPQPRAVAPVPPELLPAPQDTAPTEESTNMNLRPARFDTIAIINQDTSPKLRLTGFLADGATHLTQPELKTESGILHITIMTTRDPEVMGTMALVPFDISVDLPNPLPAQILLNGSPVITSAD